MCVGGCICVEIVVFSFRGTTETGMRKIFVVKTAVNKTVMLLTRILNLTPCAFLLLQAFFS